MKNGNKDFEKLTQDATALGQEQVEAAIKCGTILSKGMEDIFHAYVALAQNSGEKSAAAAKALMSCKTLNELTEAQNKFAQASFDDFMSSATKLSEMSVKLATECFEPINDQLGRTIKKASDAVAA